MANTNRYTYSIQPIKKQMRSKMEPGQRVSVQNNYCTYCPPLWGTRLDFFMNDPRMSSKLTPDYIQWEISLLLRSLLGLQSSNFMSCTAVGELGQWCHNWLRPDSSSFPLSFANEWTKSILQKLQWHEDKIYIFFKLMWRLEIKRGTFIIVILLWLNQWL